MTTVPEVVADPYANKAHMEWWRDAKVGMFIHWGPYAALWRSKFKDPSGWDSAWARHSYRIGRSEYREFVKSWNPYRFDADAITSLAQEAGMKYLVLTSKHHDGFCMFDSALTDFKITNTPLGRDVSKELADACARSGVNFGFYYSPRDWDHPDYLPHLQHFSHPVSKYKSWWGYQRSAITELGKNRNVFGGVGDNLEKEDYLPCGCNACIDNLPVIEERDASKADLNRYIEYEWGQIDELLKNYGDVRALWFDGQEHNQETNRTVEFLRHIRETRPGILVNDRIGTDDFKADFGIAESYIPETGEVRDWEACLTMAFSWGYVKNAHSFWSPGDLIKQMIEAVSKGGNVLINISPDDMGLVPEYQEDRLRILGGWLNRFGDAIYGTRRVNLKAPNNIYYTRKGDDLYAIQVNDIGRDLWLPGITLKDGGKVELLGCTRPVQWEHPVLVDLRTRRAGYNEPLNWSENPADGLHVRVGEIPAIHWNGEHALAFKITGVQW